MWEGGEWVNSFEHLAASQNESTTAIINLFVLCEQLDVLKIWTRGANQNFTPFCLDMQGDTAKS